jgi:hypothetical protein
MHKWNTVNQPIRARVLFKLFYKVCSWFIFFVFVYSDGWEQSGLFEFYKAKLPFIKEREVREKEKQAERGRSR